MPHVATSRKESPMNDASLIFLLFIKLQSAINTVKKNLCKRKDCCTDAYNNIQRVCACVRVLLLHRQPRGDGAREHPSAQLCHCTSRAWRPHKPQICFQGNTEVAANLILYIKDIIMSISSQKNLFSFSKNIICCEWHWYWPWVLEHQYNIIKHRQQRKQSDIKSWD